jgi:hypothetical protein
MIYKSGREKKLGEVVCFVFFLSFIFLISSSFFAASEIFRVGSGVLGPMER